MFALIETYTPDHYYHYPNQYLCHQNQNINRYQNQIINMLSAVKAVI